MRKKQNPRDALYSENFFSASWGSHQLFRIQRLMEIESQKKSVPMDKLRLAFKAKHALTLIDREGNHLSYKPEGIIDQIDIPDDETETVMFDVRWTDPWGYGYTDRMSFLEIQMKVMDQFSFARLRKSVEDAYARHKVVIS